MVLRTTRAGVSTASRGAVRARIDPIEAIGYLGDLVYHAAAKDTRINEKCRIYGVLDDRPVTVLRDRSSQPGQLQLTPGCDLAHQPVSVRSKLYLDAR